MRKNNRTIITLLLIGLLFGCGPKNGAQLPTPKVERTLAPDVESLARSFLDDFVEQRYDAMYAVLTPAVQQELTYDQFAAIYQDSAKNMTLQVVRTQYNFASINPTSAVVDFTAYYETALFGEFERQMQMDWQLVDGEWKLQWEHGDILPEMSGGNSLVLDLRTQTRGSIFDKNGLPIVEQTRAYALGITPGEIEEGREGLLLFHLSELTGKTRESIRDSYQDVGPTWYVPVGEASAAEVEARWEQIVGLGGLVRNPFESRYYYNGGVAPQAVGYVLGISPEQLSEYQKRGYLGDEKVGQAGLEKYAEEMLAGKPEASLYVVDANGQTISRITRADPKPAQSITTTIDKNLQIGAQNAMASFRGAVVVMEVETGRILAMVSSPGFDPNLFEPSNRNSTELLQSMLNDNRQVLLNRAAQSAYPLGSVFKIITAAAALESDLYTADSSYYCGYYFEELPGEVFTDWTLEKEYPPSGNLTLDYGLVRSCNPWFYHLGLNLFRQKGATWISDMARGFGLGSATGIEQVAEDPGSIPVPRTDGDAVQQGIGQGEMLVTPLQVVRFTAAIANGGTLYRPQIIETMTTSTGITTYTFQPEQQATLPISQETLETIQGAMRNVVRAQVGTAHDALRGLNITMYGKTGTAQNPMGNSHSWFTGYTQTNRTDKPDIAVVVLAENAGEGSEVAAPIFRRIIEIYYFGEPLRLYPWESSFNITRTPTLQYTLTPTETPIRPPTQEVTPTPSG